MSVSITPIIPGIWSVSGDLDTISALGNIRKVADGSFKFCENSDRCAAEIERKSGVNIRGWSRDDFPSVDAAMEYVSGKLAQA